MSQEVEMNEHMLRQTMFALIEQGKDEELLDLSKKFLKLFDRGPITYVGNGPSLTVDQLEAIEGDSIGVNRIHLIYPDTTWRPTFYVYTDRYASPNWAAELTAHMRSYPSFVRADIAYAIPQWWAYGNLKVIGECQYRPLGNNLSKEVTEPWEEGHPWHYHQHSSMCTFGGALNTSAQLAWLMGYSEFRMIGCDGVYKVDAVNHFTADYADDRQGESYDERMAGYVNHRLSYVTELIQVELKKRGVKVTMPPGKGYPKGPKKPKKKSKKKKK